MNVVLQKGEAGFLARYEAQSHRLPGEHAVREAAAAAFRASGLPTPRDEAWKFTNLRPLAEASFAAPLATEALPMRPADIRPLAGEPALVFVDGRFRRDLSVLPPRIRVAGFADAPHFGVIARTEHAPLVALNTMLAEDGALIEVEQGVDGGTLQLVSLVQGTSSAPIAFHPAHRIQLGAGARLVLFETARGGGSYCHNPLIEIEVGEGAALTHVRLQDESADSFHLATVYAAIAAGGTYDCFALNAGARLCRTEFHARLSGPGGSAHLNGAQILKGRQHSDFTSVVRHDAPHCASRQTVKNVLAGRSRGVFQGRIEVARQAQKTDGYQMNQALLLSPDAEVDSKPELEIFADDVKCSHGATVGELDREQLFYLQSRGIAEPVARSILVRAFLAEAIELVGHEGIRGVLDQLVESWWERETA